MRRWAAQDAAQAKALSLKMESLLRRFGESAYVRYGKQSGPGPLLGPIADGLSRMEEVDLDIDRLSKMRQGKLVTPKRMLMGTFGSFVLLAVALVYGRGFRSEGLLPDKRADAEARADSGRRGLGSGDPSPPRQGDPSTTATADLPPEIASKTSPPDLPLLSLPKRLSSGKERSIPHLFFSPRGAHATVAWVDSSGRRDIQLWDVATGERLMAKSDGCDYFSLPAAFSPDETRIACVDGDFLRIWDLKSEPARMVQSMRLARPSPKYSSKKLWNDLQWSKADTIILGLRSEDHRERCLQVMKEAGGVFSTLRPVQETPSKYKGKSTWFGSIAASPDGRFIAFASEPDPESHERKYLAVQIIDASSGREVGDLVYADTGHAVGQFPSAHLGLILQTVTSSAEDRRPCLEFTPDGGFLLVQAEGASDRKRSIKVIKSGTWQKVSELDVSNPESDGRQSPYSFVSYCYSREGTRLAGISIRRTRTSRGQKSERVAEIYELASGRRIREIALGDEFILDEKNEYLRSNHERLTFSPDGTALVATVVNKDYYNDEKHHSEAAWSVGSWNLVDGRKRFVLTGLLLGSVSWVEMSPGGELVATDADNLQVWDVPRLARLRAELDAGDKCWGSGDHPKAFDHYCSVLAESMAWFVEDDLPRVYSRCVDTLAERDQVAKGRLLVARSQRSELALSPETPQREGFFIRRGEIIRWQDTASFVLSRSTKVF